MINCNKSIQTLLITATGRWDTFLSQLLLVVKVWTASWHVSAVIWHLGWLGPFLLPVYPRFPSCLPLPGSRCWRCLSSGLILSLKDLGGWRRLWWKGLRGILPVPVQKARAEYIIEIQTANNILCDSQQNCRASPSPIQTKQCLMSS